ncbi:MAG: 1,6-anhydro-N-acetylmuramyl-L-alanine amidase AmpD [Aeromonas sp.]
MTLTLTADGWCPQARHVPSPHCNARAEPNDISLLVVHGISLPPRQFGGPWIDQLFQGQLDAAAHPYFAEIAHLQVSAHCLIRRDGELVQYVPFSARAWHAGQSCWQGRAACNDYSIGIELEGCDDVPYAAAQYQRLAELTCALQAAYPALGDAQIVGHSDIAPGRKTDPGTAFDWAHFRALLAAQPA